MVNNLHGQFLKIRFLASPGARFRIPEDHSVLQVEPSVRFLTDHGLPADPCPHPLHEVKEKGKFVGEKSFDPGPTAPLPPSALNLLRHYFNLIYFVVHE